jgi:hypothetical protein
MYTQYKNVQDQKYSIHQKYFGCSRKLVGHNQNQKRKIDIKHKI